MKINSGIIKNIRDKVFPHISLAPKITPPTKKNTPNCSPNSNPGAHLNFPNESREDSQLWSNFRI